MPLIFPSDLLTLLAALLQVIKRSRFPWICANARDEHGAFIEGTMPYVVERSAVVAATERAAGACEALPCVVSAVQSAAGSVHVRVKPSLLRVGWVVASARANRN